MKKCMFCLYAFSDSDLRLRCGLCGRWIHIYCADVEKKNYEIICSNSNIYYICYGCNVEKPNWLLVAKQLGEKASPTKSVIKLSDFKDLTISQKVTMPQADTMLSQIRFYFPKGLFKPCSNYHKQSTSANPGPFKSTKSSQTASADTVSPKEKEDNWL